MYTAKNRMLAMRISDEQLAAVKGRAVKAQLTMTEFFIRSALGKPIVVVEGLEAVMSELKAIGRNLNQLTTLCNMGKIQCLDLAAVKMQFGTVYELLGQILERR